MKGYFGFLIFVTACAPASQPSADVGSDVPIYVCPPQLEVEERPKAEVCDDQRPTVGLHLRRRPQELDDCPEYDSPDPPDECRTHSDCHQGKNGRCVGNDVDGFLCTYDECFTDSDCRIDQVCVCEGGIFSDNNRCVSVSSERSGCRTNADCAASGVCSPSRHYQCGADVSVFYACRTCEDECVLDEDCPALAAGKPICRFDGTKWSCSTLVPCVCDG